MANSAIITVDVATGEIVGDALSLVGKRGTVVLTSLADVTDTTITAPMFEITAYEKRLVGALFGSANPRYDIPRLLDMYMDGELKLDELVTRTYEFDDINQGYVDMREHRNIRGMVRFD
jgi:S-(hydroxymethyl)glutathione dehydrogenase/alcohol dehydrogenase